MAVAIRSGDKSYSTDSGTVAKASTLHRESELKAVVYDGSDSSEEDSSSPGNQRSVRVQMKTAAEKSLPFEVCRRDNNLQLPLDNQSSMRVSGPQLSPQSVAKFQKHILAAKSSKKTSLPNFMDISWYHPRMSRHVAESILLSKSIPDGTYLLRDSSTSDATLTMSVSYRTSVKHYRVVWDGKCLCFGLGRFKSISEFLEHFESQPVISGESGLLVYLRHPYPRNVSEPVDYEEALFTEGLEVLGDNPDLTSDSAGCLAINSKDGYLTKLGQHRKNWKLRWFRLFKNNLYYYSTRESTSPLRIIDMSATISVKRDTTMGKDFCLSLETTYRTFYMYAESESEANDWVRLLQWRLENKKQPQIN